MTSGSRGENVSGGKQGRDSVWRITKSKLDSKATSGEEPIIFYFYKKKRKKIRFDFLIINNFQDYFDCLT